MFTVIDSLQLVSKQVYNINLAKMRKLAKTDVNSVMLSLAC